MRRLMFLAPPLSEDSGSAFAKNIMMLANFHIRLRDLAHYNVSCIL